MDLIKRVINKTINIGIIGLGYVGLPLAVEFGKQYRVMGYDINENRIQELKLGNDKTLEVSKEELMNAEGLSFTSNINELNNVNIFIVTVPTPVDSYKRPDLNPLLKASKTVAKVLKKGDIVIYESTVYPGCTEEDCVPVLEKVSGLKYNTDFYCGYSPERINPGDKEHRVSSIKKVISGSNDEIGKTIKALYQSIIKAGVHLAPAIKVAEAAKVIENTQRDINIAFINELAKLFNIMGIDTNDVLDAASTKWNFLSFRPGLVGGHCIGVDPYYLTHKAVNLGFNAEMILAGRRINDNMGAYIANQFIKQLIRKGYKVNKSNVLILGITFKENCPDIRNSKVIDIIKELQEFGCNVDVVDPWADKEEVRREYTLELYSSIDETDITKYSGIILAVAHQKFNSYALRQITNKEIVIYDVKGVLDRTIIDARL